MRVDPDPAGSERILLGQYLDYQRETMLSKAEGLTQRQLAIKHAPSELTLAGLLYHLALVEEDWMEVRFLGFHLIEETARHAGHADVLREAIDGTVGP